MRRAALASITALSGALALVAGVVAQAGRADRDRSEGVALTAAGDAARRWARLPDARLARSEVAAARIGDAAYVVGGFIAGGATTAAAERVDLRSGQRRRVAPMPLALNHPAAATWRGRLYVVGGYRQGLAKESAALLRYEPRASIWPVPSWAAASTCWRGGRPRAAMWRPRSGSGPGCGAGRRFPPHGAGAAGRPQRQPPDRSSWWAART